MVLTRLWVKWLSKQHANCAVFFCLYISYIWVLGIILVRMVLNMKYNKLDLNENCLAMISSFMIGKKTIRKSKFM